MVCNNTTGWRHELMLHHTTKYKTANVTSCHYGSDNQVQSRKYSWMWLITCIFVLIIRHTSSIVFTPSYAVGFFFLKRILREMRFDFQHALCFWIVSPFRNNSEKYEAYSESQYRFVVKTRVRFRTKFYCYQILHSSYYFCTYSPPLLTYLS